MNILYMALSNTKIQKCFCGIDKPKFCFKIDNNEVLEDRSVVLCFNCNMTINEHNFFYYKPFTVYTTKIDKNDILVNLPIYEFIFDKNDNLVPTG